MDGFVYLIRLTESPDVNPSDSKDGAMEGRFNVLHRFQLNSSKSIQTVHGSIPTSACHVALSKDGQWMALCDSFHQVSLLNMDTLQYHPSPLPSFDAPITSLTFHPSSPVLVITLASNVFYLFDPETLSLTDWSASLSHRLPDRFVHRKDIIMGVAFPPSKASGANKMVLYGTTYFCVVDLSQKLGPANAALCRPGLKRGHDQQDGGASQVEEVIDVDAEKPVYSDAFKMDHRFQDLMFLDIMSSSGEWVVVERPALEVMKTLPPGFYKKAYGT
jgi:U3 small nucleolar RNA-associated protein 4